MTELVLLRDTVVVLALALLNAFLFSKVRLSPVIGYLVTGMLVGPYGFNVIRETHEVELLAEIGVVLLLFTVGLEFSFSRILRLRGLMLKSGLTQILLSGLFVYGCALGLGLGPRAAGVLGMALALSSTAIVLKLLFEAGEIDAAHGRISLAILLFQDLSVVVFLLALPLVAGTVQTISIERIAETVALLGGLFIFSRYLLQPLLRVVLRTRIQELFRLTVLTLVLATAWITGEAGLSLALGAFLAGLALAESDYSHQVLSDIVPFRDAFLAFFFVSVGMLLDGGFVIKEWPVILGGLVVLTFAKVSTATVAALVSRYPLRTALATGLLLFQVGEFSFILLKQAVLLDAVSVHVYQISLAIIAFSMMATPVLAARAPALAERFARLLGRKTAVMHEENRERTGNLKDHVVIAGYGVSARNVARVLRDARIPYVHVEINGDAVTRARAAGEFIVYGDATSEALLTAVGITKARAFVLAINDPSAVARSIPTARALNPNLYILARTKFVLELDHLTSLGADDVISDEFEASLQMAASLLRRFAVAEGETLKLIAALRQEHYEELRETPSPPPDLARYLAVLDQGQIEFLAVPDTFACVGRTLEDMHFRTRTGTMVVGIIRQSRVHYSPAGDASIEPGDTLMLLGHADDVERAREFLHNRTCEI